MNQKVIITGASGGFGFLTCHSLVAKGHQVVGTMRSTKGKNEIVAQELNELGVHIVEMDVTDNESVNNGIAEVINHMHGLDVLINNAGVGVLGMQEHYTAEDMQRIFDVNVFGVQRVTRAVLPHLRKQHYGILVFISDLLGRITLPFYGIYNSSKWALEALAENYRTELSRFGIESCIVEPGGYATTFVDNLVQPSDNSRNKEYGRFMHMPKTMFESFEQSIENNIGQKPQKVAEAIADLLDKPYAEKPLRTVVDYMGMADYIEDYNKKLNKITRSIYSAYNMEEMLEVQRSSEWYAH
ncbi:SDR family oxidoreductase [Labilibacter sediminis]|nr:SDR family oxidoreductase [Labilibacter sediminis]